MNCTTASLRLLASAALLSFGALGAGCASQTAVMAGYAKPVQAPSFRLIDERPQSQRETRFLSLLITSCNYGVRQFGDAATAPDRITLLEQNLNAALREKLTNQTLVVTSYGIYLSNQTAMRAQIYGHHPDLVSAIMQPMGAHCDRDRMKGGWYSPDEVTTPYPPIVVDITVKLNGRTYQAHSVFSPSKGLDISAARPATSAAIFIAMQNATDQLIKELQAG